MGSQLPPSVLAHLEKLHNQALGHVSLALPFILVFFFDSSSFISVMNQWDLEVAVFVLFIRSLVS